MNPGQAAVRARQVIQLRLLADPEDAQGRKCHLYERRGESTTSARHKSCSLRMARPAGRRRSKTSRVIATAKIPSLKAASRSTLWPAIWLYDRAMGSESSRRDRVCPRFLSSLSCSPEICSVYLDLQGIDRTFWHTPIESNY